MTRAAADVNRAPASAEDRLRHRSHDRLRDDERRVGEAIEEVTALEARAEGVDRFAVRGRRRPHRRFELLGLRVVFDADQRSQRELRASGLDVIARDGGIRL
jgi:hypothetical protein